MRSWLLERHPDLHMRRWLLEYDDPSVERAFRSRDDAECLEQALVVVWVAVGFTAVYGVIDHLIADDVLASTLIRFGLVLPVFVGGRLLLAPSSVVARHVQPFAIALLAFTLLTLGTLTDLTTDLPVEYLRTSCTVTLIGGIGLLRIRMHAAIVMVAVFVAVSLLLDVGERGTDQLADNVAPTLGLASIAMLVAYALERLRRTDYLRQREVELEQARSDELLHNVLPVPIADRLRTEPGVIAESAAEVSVLFSDIVGFTPLSEQLSPEELVHLLDTMFREFDDLCERHGVEKIKTVGDAYMAVAGLATPDPDHAASMAELALDMQRASTRLSEEWPGPMSIRIGIASGPVVAGVIGQRKFSYDLWGDTVNTASRMESHSRANRIQVSGSTYELLRDDYAFSDPQEVDVKGKGPMTTYFLLGAGP